MADTLEAWISAIESEPPWLADVALLSLPSDARKNTEVVLLAVRRNGLSLRAAGAGLRGDRRVVLAAVEQDCGALRYAFLELRSDPEVVSAAVRQSWQALDYACPLMRLNEAVLAAGEAAHGPPSARKAAPTASVEAGGSSAAASAAKDCALAEVPPRARAGADVHFHGIADALGALDVWFFFAADQDARVRVVFQQELLHRRLPGNRGVVRYIGRTEGFSGGISVTWTHLAKGIDPQQPASAEASELIARKVTRDPELQEPAKPGKRNPTFHSPVFISFLRLGVEGLTLFRAHLTGSLPDPELCLSAVDGESTALQEEMIRRYGLDDE